MSIYKGLICNSSNFEVFRLFSFAIRLIWNSSHLQFVSFASHLGLEWIEGLSKTLRGLVYFATYFSGERSPPEDYVAKYTSPLRVFDTPSIHSNPKWDAILARNANETKCKWVTSKNLDPPRNANEPCVRVPWTSCQRRQRSCSSCYHVQPPTARLPVSANKKTQT